MTTYDDERDLDRQMFDDIMWRRVTQRCLCSRCEIEYLKSEGKCRIFKNNILDHYYSWKNITRYL